MALTDDRGMVRAAPAADYDRQPPQDMSAEQSVLGGMLLSKDAIADVVEVLRPGDFYRPAHQVVYECILDLYGRGEPADPITVSSELERRGELLRIGGAPYLHTLIATVPTAANAGYYAEIVADKAILRRLVEAGTRIVQLGYHGADGADVDEVVDRAQAAVYEVTDRRTSEDYVALEALLEPTMQELEDIETRGLAFGVPTGFEDLDAVTNGLHPGQMVIIAARPGIGKALALDTPLPTPLGWTTMGEVAIGDRLIGADGRPVTVVATSEVMLGRPCYEIEFCDGAVIVADGSHQWLTEARASRRSGSPRTCSAVRTTEELAATLHCPTPARRSNHSVINCAPLHLPERNLPVPPYALGVRLGHGSGNSAASPPVDPEIAVRVEEEGTVASPGDTVDGALGDKHVPAAYLRASPAQRRALLAGLLDTGGTVSRTGSVRFTTTDGRLASDVHELVVGLGYRCSTERSPAAYTITFTASDDVFRLQRKHLMHKQRRPDSGTVGTGSRFVVDVRRVTGMPVRCVQVDSADRLYLAGRSMIPTHNSTLGLDFARSCSVRHGLTSVIFSLEMSRTEIVMRLLSAEAGIPLADMRTGRMNDDKWAKLARKMSEVSEAPLFVDDSPNMTMMEIRAKARRLKHRHGLRLIVVDYMQLMTSGKRVESRQQEVSEFSRQLKLLAKELEVPVVTISQLNRGPEQRTDKKPMLGDLRESGSLEQDADVVLLIHRPDAFERDDPRAGEADLIIAKHRNGPTATITVTNQLHLSRFANLARM
jgi:replicative DNA helicase